MEVIWDYSHGINPKYWLESTITYNQQLYYYKTSLKKSCAKDISSVIVSFIIWPPFKKNHIMYVKWRTEFYPAVVTSYNFNEETGNQNIYITWPGWASKWDQWMDREVYKSDIILYDIKPYSREIGYEMRKHTSISIRKK